MFDGIGPKQMQELMVQARKQAEELQKSMQTTIIEASSGGGAVSVKVNGRRQILELKIDAEVARSGDLEMLQDLIIAAVNEAGRKVEEAMSSSLGGMLNGVM